MTDMTPPTTVDIEIWTRPRATAPGTQTGYTLTFTDKTGVHRIATHETEFEARQFARKLGWAVGRVAREDMP